MSTVQIIPSRCPAGQAWDTIDNVCREEEKVEGPVTRQAFMQLRTSAFLPSDIPASDPKQPILTAPIPPEPFSLPPIIAEAPKKTSTNTLLLLGGAALLAYLVLK